MSNGGGIHCGCVMLGALLAVVAAVIIFTLGWRWLWIVPALVALFWLLMFVVTLFEDRWRVVTPEHERMGVPARCAACGEEVSAIVGKARFKTRCPICGHRESGVLRKP